MLGIFYTEIYVIKIHVQALHMLRIMIVEYVSYANGVVKYVHHHITVQYAVEHSNFMKVGVMMIVHSTQSGIPIHKLLH